jgi:histidinol phosphatase-like enzyme
MRSLNRKPEIGMLAEIETNAQESGLLIDWDRSLFVGDRSEDRECAERAGMMFTPAHEFFGREEGAEK